MQSQIINYHLPFKMFLRKMINLTVNQLILVTFIFCVFILFLYSYKDSSLHEVNDTRNPVILWWTSGFPLTSDTITCPNNIKCDVFSDNNISQLYNVEAYLFYGSGIKFDNLPLPRKKSDLWGIFHEESPRNVEELLHDKVLNLFNFSSTFSRHSNVPFPLQYLEAFRDITDTKYFVTTQIKNNYSKEIAPVMYLQTDCETSTERDDYVKELMKYIPIDSYGACLKNKDLPQRFIDDYLNNLNDDEFLKFTSRYKFTIAIENGVCEDYVTEKLWRAIKVGTVPIYFGSPSIKELLPNEKSAVLLEDFPTAEVLAKHLYKLLKNDSLYEQYLEHKTKGIVTNSKLIEEVNTRTYQLNTEKTSLEFECYVCGKLHEKRSGMLGSNIVTKSHYDCPKPVSALTLQANPTNPWVYSWREARKRANEIVRKVNDN